MPQPAEPSASHTSSSLLLRLLGAVDRVTEWVEKIILGSSVLFLAGLLIVHVLGRQLLGNGVTGQVELTQISLIIMTFAGLGYAVRRARHISMSAFFDQLSGKPRKALMILIALGTAALMFYLAWHAAAYVMTIHDRGRTSSALQIPLWIPYLAAPVGFVLAGIQFVLTAVRNLISPEVYRSFTEKDEYDAIPDDGAL
ncbi:TRAP transporter small permease [Halopseudomonas pachastrellae]|uniref:TRAP transporter small permease n=1 Tax=Halopseudomonas pachastrellae TaxID=254161 RepID=UPI003D7DFD40